MAPATGACGRPARGVLRDRLGLGRYYQGKFEQARRLLTEIGGHPDPRPLQLYRRVWHALFCGLGDFDHKYGYRWLEEGGLQYAKPIIESRSRVYVPPTMNGNNSFEVRNDTLPAAAFWDRERLYRRLPYGMPEYDQVIRGKVLGDIGHARFGTWESSRAGRSGFRPA